MTVIEFLDSLPEENREIMVEFHYSRTLFKYPLPSISPELLAREYVESLPENQQRVVLSFGRLNKPNIFGCISSAACKVAA